ncbi:MAG TPA: hypothetical protein VD994_07000 [Prosthecobacter sp.]|nr:hypothetical protein [Prosthecobacter sp.]
MTAGVTTFSCESFTDLARVSGACEANGVEARVLLRVNPAEAPDARLAMSGVDSQFGFSETLLLQDEARAKVFLPRLRICGVHVYFGTQVAGVDALAANTRRALECAERVARSLGFECVVVNAGGGFPWPFASDAPAPDFTALEATLGEVCDRSPLARVAALWFESGRYIVAGSGTLVARVMDVKRLPTRTFVLLDTGIHHLSGMSGLGRVPRPGMSVRNLSRKPADAETILADLAGPLCTPLDCVARSLSMPAVEEGDLVAIPNVGAYGLTASLTSFLSHPAPVEVAYGRGASPQAFQLRGGHAAFLQTDDSR